MTIYIDRTIRMTRLSPDSSNKQELEEVANYLEDQGIDALAEFVQGVAQENHKKVTTVFRKCSNNVRDC